MSDPQHQSTVILNLSSFDNDNNTNDHHHNNNNTGGMNDNHDCFMTELRELFNIFDRNRDGMISLEDFQSVLDSVGLYPSLEELQALMQHANDDNNSQASTMSSSEDGSYTTTMSKQHVRNNNNNNITFSQFVTIMKAKIVSSNTIPISPEEIQNIFSVFDRDGDGFITGSELKQMTSALGMQLSDQDVQKMIHEADVDGDSMINLEEFLRYVSH